MKILMNINRNYPGVGSLDNVMKHLKNHDDFFKLTTNSFIKEKKF